MSRIIFPIYKIVARIIPIWNVNKRNPAIILITTSYFINLFWMSSHNMLDSVYFFFMFIILSKCQPKEIHAKDMFLKLPAYRETGSFQFCK